MTRIKRIFADFLVCSKKIRFICVIRVPIKKNLNPKLSQMVIDVLIEHIIPFCLSQYSK